MASPREAMPEASGGGGAPLERLGTMLAKLPGSGSVVGYWQTMRGADGSGGEKAPPNGSGGEKAPEIVLWTRIQRIDGADGGGGASKLVLLLGESSWRRAVGRAPRFGGPEGMAAVPRRLVRHLAVHSFVRTRQNNVARRAVVAQPIVIGVHCPSHAFATTLLNPPPNSANPPSPPLPLFAGPAQEPRKRAGAERS